MLSPVEATKQKAARERSGRWFVYKLAFFSGLGGFLFGFDTGVVSGALPLLSRHFSLSPFLQELVVSGAVGGAILGAAGGGIFSDRFGRKPSILLASLLFVGGAAMMGGANDIYTLVGGRGVAGLGVGLASMSVPVYIAEIAPQKSRGALVGCFVLFVTGGQFISYLIDYLFSATNEGWRYMLGISGLPGLLQFLGMLFVPESPRWIAMNKNVESARRILLLIRDDADEVNSELDSIVQSLGEEISVLQGLKELVKPGLRRALALGLGLQALQQLCGINTVMYYSTSIIRQAGFTGNGESILLSLPIAFINFAFTIVAMFLIDRAGRRILLLSTIPALSVSCESSFFVDVCPSSSPWRFLALPAMSLYIIFFAAGMGPVPWAVNSEIFPTRLRSTANSLSTIVNWAVNLIVSITFLSLVEVLSAAGAFLLYAGMGVVAFGFVFFFLPETANKSMEQVQLLFSPSPKGGEEDGVEEGEKKRLMFQIPSEEGDLIGDTY